LTLESQEKYPFLIEIAGSPGSRGGFGRRILSSAKSSSSRRFKDTFALTTCQTKSALEARKQHIGINDLPNQGSIRSRKNNTTSFRKLFFLLVNANLLKKRKGTTHVHRKYTIETPN
jgi:hypothetical protein